MWLQRLVGWLRGALGVEERPPRPLEVMIAQEGECKAFLLFSDRESPVEGIVEVWLLRHELSATKDCVILLINIVQIRETYGDWDELQSDLLPQHWRRAFEYRARTEIKLQRQIAGTHLFMVGWLSKKAVASRFVGAGKVEHYRHIECQRVYSVDLVGTLQYLSLNEPARRIIRAIVKRAIAIEPTPLNLWEEIVFSLGEPTSKTTWLDWLNHYATRPKSTRISHDHILQPPKADLRRFKGEE